MPGQSLSLLLVFAVFPLAVALLRRMRRAQSFLWGAVNVLGALGVCFLANVSSANHENIFAYTALVIGMFSIYLALALFHFFSLCSFSKKGSAEKMSHFPWLPFFLPIAALIVVKYTPVGSINLKGILGGTGRLVFTEFLVGLSYLAFRLSYLTIEVRSGSVQAPSLGQYLGFAFFVPTLSVGPITTYRNFQSGTGAPPVDKTASLHRVIVGAAKFLVLGTVFNQLSYRGLLLDGHPHHWVDLGIAGLSFYLFLYFNFSGYCDMAIGAAGLIDIRVSENFDNPLTARNIKDFWNRWHMTLSSWTRDIIFNPLSFALSRRWSPQFANYAVTVAIIAVFLVIGVWHGAGWNFAIFGLIHGVGMVAHHWYTVILKKRLGKQGLLAYQANTTIRWLATGFTFLFVAFSLFFFANDFSAMKQIFSVLQ